MPSGELSREAIGATERFGRKILAALKGNSPLLSENPPRLQQLGLMKLGTDRPQDRGARAWRPPRKEGPHLIVPGDLPPAE